MKSIPNYLKNIFRILAPIFRCTPPFVVGIPVVLAKMRLAIKKILRKHGYPPDMELKAMATVLEQAKLLANDFSSNSTYNLNRNELGMVAEP